MTPDQAISEAERGALRPVYLVLGEERYFADRVVAAIRRAANAGGIAGFNEDKFTAGEAPVEAAISAARMLPMMAKWRLVLLRDVDRWEKKAEGDDASQGRSAGPLDVLADYAQQPIPTSVVVLSAAKLRANRRLVTYAKKQDFVVACDRLGRRDLPRFVQVLAREQGQGIDSAAAEQLAEVGGAELAGIADAIERLSLYVGPEKPITEEAVAKLVTRVRQSTVWELLDALARRRLDRALATLATVFEARDGGLPLLGSIAWSVRQLVKLESALAAGIAVPEAAQRAGVASFKANDLARVVRTAPRGMLERWLALLSEADLALKGSRRPPQAVVETLLVDMCRVG